MNIYRDSRYEGFVGIVLFAQCTDFWINRVTEKLFKKYRTAEDYTKTYFRELENDIYSTGFYKNKVNKYPGCYAIDS